MIEQVRRLLFDEGGVIFPLVKRLQCIPNERLMKQEPERARRRARMSDGHKKNSTLTGRFVRPTDEHLRRSTSRSIALPLLPVFSQLTAAEWGSISCTSNNEQKTKKKENTP
jgi:hypothetical protein